MTVSRRRRSTLLALGVVLGAALVPPGADAAAFVTGSDGRDGSRTISGVESIVLPEDGILRFASLSVEAGATLRFVRNARDTPVIVLATGAIIIDGSIDVSGEAAASGDPAGGRGGPGGFDGGSAGTAPRGGLGPGGGAPGLDGDGRGERDAGSGAFTTRGSSAHESAGDGLVHDARLAFLGGSGGGGTPDLGGGGGGGAILLASDERIVINGRVLAHGGAAEGCHASPGSGGAIWLAAPSIVGRGVVDVDGGSGDARCSTGGMGFVRIATASGTASESLGAARGLGLEIRTLEGLLDVTPRAAIVSARGATLVRPGLPALVRTADATPVVLGLEARGMAGDLLALELSLVSDTGARGSRWAYVSIGESGMGHLTLEVALPGNALTTIHATQR